MFLKVDSAYPEDQGGGKVRLDPETMLQLRVSPGDLVYLKGKRQTVAKVWRLLVNDWNQEKVRIDNYTRLNAGVSLGDRLEITTIGDLVMAEQVLLAPPEDLVRQIPINFNQVVNHLIGFPLVKNDTIPIQAGLPFMQPQMLAFKVVSIEPENAVIIAKDTEINFSDKPVAGFESLKHISYEDVGGLKGELQHVRETIELPLRHPELFNRLGIEPPKGVLLYGPPGTGKTLIAKAVANESGAHFISIAGPEVISKYYGESEQRLREIFDEAEENAPSIIFIDELDSIAPKRENVSGEVERRVVAQLLTMMDGLEERGQVVVIGATNRLDAIDQALRRPGRFDREIEIGVPSESDRQEILKIHTKRMPLEGDEHLLLKTAELKRIRDELKNIENEEKSIISLLKENSDENLRLEANLKSLGNAISKNQENSKKLKTTLNALTETEIETESESEQDQEIIIAKRESAREKCAQAGYESIRLENEYEIVKTSLTGIDTEKSVLEEKLADRKEKIRNISACEEVSQKEISSLEEDVKKNREKLIKELSVRTTGFVGADLAALAREAAMRTLRRYLPDIDIDVEEIPQETLESMKISVSDFRDTLREMNPSAMREVFLEVSHLVWDDIGGLEKEKEEVREAVEYPLTRAEQFENLGIEPPKGVLLYGPPGTGKTMIAKAVANESGANFIPVRGPQLLSKWVGESERAVREIFRKARQVAPAIIFFDELDALAPARGGGDAHVIESVVNQILTELDGLEDMRGVVVMGATNRPDIIDPALLRTGRFDRLVYIGEPDFKNRIKILEIHTALIPVKGSALEEVMSITEGMGETDLEKLILKAGGGEEGFVKAGDLKLLIPVDYVATGNPLSVPARRRKIINLLKDRSLRLTDPVRDNLFKELAGCTDGYVGSDIEQLCREAAMFAMREGESYVNEDHFRKASKKVRPMMNERLRDHYKRIKNYFKGGLPAQVQPPEYQ